MTLNIRDWEAPPTEVTERWKMRKKLNFSELEVDPFQSEAEGNMDVTFVSMKIGIKKA